MATKPKCQLSGQDGNVYAVIGAAQKALRKAGQEDNAKKMKARIDEEAEDYEGALRIIMEFVDAK